MHLFYRLYCVFWKLSIVFIVYFGKKTISVGNLVESDRWNSSANDVALNCLNWPPMVRTGFSSSSTEYPRVKKMVDYTHILFWLCTGKT